MTSDSRGAGWWGAIEIEVLKMEVTIGQKEFTE